MLDRESTFADPAIVEMLKTNYIPVAIDQWYQRRQDDAEGRLYRSIAKQGPRNNFNSTTQGFYVTDAANKLYHFNNNRGPKRIRAMLKQTLNEFVAPKVLPISNQKLDPKYVREIPSGAAVVRVNAKVLGGYEETENEWKTIFQNAISRDNLWVLKDELADIRNGKFPKSFVKRLAKFHLIDNTRGEPPMWSDNALHDHQLNIDDHGAVNGSFHLETPDGKRGFVGRIRGQIKFDQDDRPIQFDLVANGKFWGAGKYTPNPPKGKFPFAVAFRLADGSDVADTVPPQGTKGWADGYFR